MGIEGAQDGQLRAQCRLRRSHMVTNLVTGRLRENPSERAAGAVRGPLVLQARQMSWRKGLALS